MADSAVAVAPLSQSHDCLSAAIRSETAPSWSPIRFLFDASRRFIHRVWAKLAFHDQWRYRILVRQACLIVSETEPSVAVVRTLRKRDPQGLGVWYLARIKGQVQLANLCRQLIRSPGIGPPRSIAQSLERALAGEPVCWFGEAGGFDVLTSQSLIATALGSALSAWELLRAEGQLPWTTTLSHLTITANTAQSAVSAHRRVIGRPFTAAEEAARLAYQAVNVIRRAMNRTDLMAVDEQLAHESARLALASAHAACTAALELLARPVDHSTRPEADAASEKLASLARTVNALASRILTAMRTDSLAHAPTDTLIEQAAKVLTDAPKTLRPWGIQLPSEKPTTGADRVEELARRSHEIAQDSTDILQRWAVLHELMLPSASSSDKAMSPGRTAIPARRDWAVRLVAILTDRWSSQDVVAAIRDLSGPLDRSVSAAACIAALQHGTLQLQRDLWKLVRSAHSSALEKSLAFQLFWRLC